jgi:hypothetical protein
LIALTRASWISLGILACVTIAATGCRRPQMVSTVDPTSIRSIEIGMTEQQVTAILGPPLQIRPWGPTGAIYDYAIPGWALWSPGLWIQFENGGVQTIQGKRHPILGDDHAVYELRADRPPFERPDFESTFSRGR